MTKMNTNPLQESLRLQRMGRPSYKHQLLERKENGQILRHQHQRNPNANGDTVLGRDLIFGTE